MRKAAQTCLLAIAVSLWCAQNALGENLLVHEWGLFIWLQDEAGKEIGGINVENDPVPPSWREAPPGPLLPVTVAADNRNPPRAHADVRMRMERATIRFYAEPGFTAALDVTMSLIRSWPRHYAPAATLTLNRFAEGAGAALHPGFWSQLEWKEIHLAGAGEKQAAALDVEGEEATALSYRLMGNRSAPLKVVRDGAEFLITQGKTQQEIDQLWMVDVRPGSGIAFRVLRPLEPELAFLIRTPVGFSAQDYSSGNLDLLRDSLREAALEAGLFESEVEEMLACWQKSSLQDAGLRLFFFAPYGWAIGLPPLKIRRTWLGGSLCDGCAEPTTSKASGRSRRLEPMITRLMLGRIELVTPEQRAVIAGLGRPDDPFAQIDWEATLARYERLGSFRNALVLDEQRRRPTAPLEDFIRHFHLDGYTPSGPF